MNYLDIIPRILSAEQVSAAKAFIDNHQTFVISAHMSPDGDALGSALSMQHYLRAKGKKATIVFNDAPGENLSFVPREEGDILIFDNQNNNSIPSQKEEVIKAIDESDAMVCVDFNTPSRLGNMKDVFMNHQAPKLLLDHHLDPAVENFDIVVSEPSECAACEVIFRFIVEMGDEQLIDKQLATTLFCGIMTDTGWVFFNSDRPEIHLIMARLMQEGVNREEIIKDSHLTLERRVRVQGYLMSQKLHTVYEHKAAYFSLSSAEIKRYGAHGLSVGSIVNYMKKADILPQKLLVCHVGSGSSVTAVFEGKSLDTTMGYTPLEGMMMSTRSGSIDPAAALAIKRAMKFEDDEDLDDNILSEEEEDKELTEKKNKIRKNTANE